jgi:hypothetical protein
MNSSLLVRSLNQSIELRQLKKHVNELQKTVELLASLVDMEELESKRRLEASTPSLAVFKDWHSKHKPPALPEDDWEGAW